MRCICVCVCKGVEGGGGGVNNLRGKGSMPPAVPLVATLKGGRASIRSITARLIPLAAVPLRDEG